MATPSSLEELVSRLSDPDWKNLAFRYLDESLKEVWVTSIPNTVEEGIDHFTWVRDISPRHKPKYIQVNYADGKGFKILPIEYDYQTDEWDEIA